MDTSNNSLGLSSKIKKVARPYQNTRDVTAGQLCSLITSAKFRELERAIKTIRAAERVLRNLPEALNTLNRPFN